MNILIPVDDSDFEVAKLSSIEDAQYWLIFDLIESKVSNTQFYQSREEISDLIDMVIVKDQKEYVGPFIDEGIAVLVAPTQRCVDDIIEAYLLKELHDMNV